MLSYAALRERVAALVLASSGIRVGAFEEMTPGHLEELDGGIVKLMAKREECHTGRA